MGEISKILFGVFDENDADYDDEEIRRFEKNSDDTADLLKQQVYVIDNSVIFLENSYWRGGLLPRCWIKANFLGKSTLGGGALNDTLADTELNDKLAIKGLPDIQTYLNTLSSETAP